MVEVRAWLADLDAAPGHAGTLSPDEHERAARFTDATDRRRWTAARHFLRAVLAAVRGEEPGSIRFNYTGTGRPLLSGGPWFSLSHSGSWALLAASHEAQVGADLEQVRPELTRPPSVERLFDQSERARLEALPEAQRVRAFFELWTEKEARRKATGEGIAAGLGGLDVGGWTVLRPPAPTGYVGAIVVRAEAAALQFEGWPPQSGSSSRSSRSAK